MVSYLTISLLLVVSVYCDIDISPTKSRMAMEDAGQVGEQLGDYSLESGLIAAGDQKIHTRERRSIFGFLSFVVVLLNAFLTINLNLNINNNNNNNNNNNMDNQNTNMNTNM